MAASAGNHALGVAFAAQALGGRRRTPRSSSPRRRRGPRSRSCGASRSSLIETGATYDDAYAAAMAHVGERRAPPTSTPTTTRARRPARGRSASRSSRSCPTWAPSWCPCGGGGLIAAIAAVAKARRARRSASWRSSPRPRPPSASRCARGEALHEYAAGPTLADGLAGGIGDIVFAHRDLIDEVVEVSEAEIEEAIVALLADDQVVAEGAGAVGVAALRAGRSPRADGRPVAIVVTRRQHRRARAARLLRARACEGRDGRGDRWFAWAAPAGLLGLAAALGAHRPRAPPGPWPEESRVSRRASPSP